MTNHVFKVSFLAFLCSMLAISCGDDSGSSAESTRKIENKTITGVAQKGPFIQGSAITIFELDEDLKRTDFSIKTVTNDQGEFSVKVNNPASPSAIFKVNGIYLNEITGEESHNKVSLYAFTDLSKRNEVNINVLTHLAHKRALYLASEKELPVDSAKKQAETEVLNAFGIDENFDDAEDLSISGENDQNAALLAMSVLMQGGIPDDALNRILSEFASDFEKDGTLDDAKTATLIADWAYKQYVNYKLAKIPSNLKKWNLSTNVALLKKYMNSYWHHNYGLGNCSGKRQNEVRRNKNYMSNYDSFYFICNSKEWREATESEIEKYYKPDFSESGENNSNKKKEGDVRGKKANYDGNPMTCEVYEHWEWRPGNPSDCMLGFGGCTKKLQGIVRQNSDGVQYVCDHQRWLSLDDCKKILGCELYSEMPNLGWNNAQNGDIRTDKKTGLVYVFDLVAWRLASIPEVSLGGCTEDNLYSIGFASKREGQIDSALNCEYKKTTKYDESRCYDGHFDEGYYKCVKSTNMTYDPKKESFDQTKFYSTYKWIKATDSEVDIYMLGELKDGKPGETRWGPVNTDKCYAFGQAWNSVDVTQCILGLGVCNSERKGTVELGPAISIGCGNQSCESGGAYRQASIIEGAEKRWYVCHVGKLSQAKSPHTTSWDRATDIEIDIAPAVCEYPHNGEIMAGKKGIYVCSAKKDEFRNANNYEIDIYNALGSVTCNSDNFGKMVSGKENKYVCDNPNPGVFTGEVFRLARPIEAELNKACTVKKQGEYELMDGTKSYFRCWLNADTEDSVRYVWKFVTQTNEDRWSQPMREFWNDGLMTDPRDSSTYTILNIGTQTWMTENLHYADSVNYPSMQGRSWRAEEDTEAGLLYSWSAVIDSVYWASKGKTCGNTGDNKKSCELPEKVQGICPDGWHIPTVQEIEQLKSWIAKMQINKSDLDFIQVYLGKYNPDNGFSDDGKFSYFWTSTEIDGAKASEWKMNNDESSFTENEKRIGNAVRCVKDD